MKTLTDLIKVTENGITREDYSSIVQILFNEYRKIYGYDIDLDPRTADARFIYDVATIIDTGLLAITRMYSYLDPSTATGNYLDVLCSLTNVQRRSATHSYASVTFSNETENDILLTATNSVMVDDSRSHEWQIVPKTSEYSMSPYLTGDATLTVPSGGTATFVYQCEDSGPIETTSLHFLTTDSTTTNLTFTVDNVSVGEREETDAELRERRAEDSNYGITILQGIQGSLKSISGVESAKVYSYSGDPDETGYFYLDNVKYEMPSHSVAIVLRKNSVNSPSDTEIAETIYSMLTPGISTWQKTGSLQTSYSFLEQGTESVTRIYWNVAQGVHPTITVTLSPFDTYAGKTAAESVAQSLTSWLNNLSVGYRYTQAQVMQTIQNADPLYMSQNTFSVVSFSGLGDNLSIAENRVNKGSFFDYSGYTISKISNDWSSFTIQVA